MSEGAEPLLLLITPVLFFRHYSLDRELTQGRRQRRLGERHKTMGLRTVPTIVIAHTFCASPDTRISYGWCSLIQAYFCAVQNYVKKSRT